MKILLVGCYGQLGWELHRTLMPLGQVYAVDFPQIDMGDADSIRMHIEKSAPDVVFNASAYTDVDRAESEPEKAMGINAFGPGILADECLKRRCALIHYSTDYVFDGKKGTCYKENDETNPLGVYGESKLKGEQAIQQIGGSYLILRTSWVYSLRRSSFVTKLIGWAENKKELQIVDDQIGNPTWARMLAQVSSLLAVAGKENIYAKFTERAGIYHTAGGGYCSRLDWAREILRLRGMENFRLTAGKTDDFPAPAQRPLFSALNCEAFEQTFGILIPEWKLCLGLAMAENNQ